MSGGRLWETAPAEFSRCMQVPVVDVDAYGEPVLGERCMGSVPRYGKGSGSLTCKSCQAALASRRDRAAQILLLNAERAAQRLVSSLGAVDERVGLRASESLLNRVGLSERQNITVTAGAETTGHDSMIKALFEVDGEDDGEAALPSGDGSA